MQPSPNDEYPPKVAKFVASYRPCLIIVEDEEISDERLQRIEKQVGPEDRILASVYVTEPNKLLLVKNADSGKWTEPIGWVERDECIEDAAIREVREESGLKIELDKGIALVSLAWASPTASRVRGWTAIFRGRAIGGSLNPTDAREIGEARFFSREEVAKLVSRAEAPRYLLSQGQW